MKLFTYEEIKLDALDDGFYNESFLAPMSKDGIEALRTVHPKDRISIDGIEYTRTGMVLGAWGVFDGFRDLRSVCHQYVDSFGNFLYHVEKRWA